LVSRTHVAYLVHPERNPNKCLVLIGGSSSAPFLFLDCCVLFAYP
jgi:hypothetical protein